MATFKVEFCETVEKDCLGVHLTLPDVNREIRNEENIAHYKVKIIGIIQKNKFYVFSLYMLLYMKELYNYVNSVNVQIVLNGTPNKTPC